MMKLDVRSGRQGHLAVYLVILGPLEDYGNVSKMSHYSEPYNLRILKLAHPSELLALRASRKVGIALDFLLSTSDTSNC